MFGKAKVLTEVQVTENNLINDGSNSQAQVKQDAGELALKGVNFTKAILLFALYFVFGWIFPI